VVLNFPLSHCALECTPAHTPVDEDLGGIGVLVLIIFFKHHQHVSLASVKSDMGPASQGSPTHALVPPLRSHGDYRIQLARDLRNEKAAGGVVIRVAGLDAYFGVWLLGWLWSRG
jgi:hypothetical protein